MPAALLILAIVPAGFSGFFAIGAYACLPDRPGMAITAACIAAMAGWCAADLVMVAVL